MGKKICFHSLEFATWLFGDNLRDLNFALSFANVKPALGILSVIGLCCIMIMKKQMFVVFMAKVRGR